MPALMPNPVFRWFVPAQNGTGLVPAAGYIAAFYEAGTDIAKTIYMPDGTPYPSPANEAELNSEGYAEIWLGAGSYKLRVLDPDRAEIYTLDNINGEGSFSTGFLDTVIATDDPMTNGLAQYDTSNRFVWCAGYYAIGDGGHGFFWNQTSSDSDDGGYIIASTFNATKRWFRIPDEDGAVRAASFGYIGTKTGNLTNQLLAACAYAYSYGFKLLIGPGSVATVGNMSAFISLYAPEFYLEPGSMLTSNGTMTKVVFNGIVTGSREQHFTGCGYEFETSQVDDHPEWVGGYPTGAAADNAAAFALWFASEAGAYILGPGVWDTTTTPPWPAGAPVLLFGSISVADGPDFPTGCYFPDDSRFRLGEIRFPGGGTVAGSGDDVAIGGDVVVAGGVSATESISTDTHVVADGDVSAGIAGPAVLSNRAGSGTKRYLAGGTYSVYTGSGASTGGTTETILLSETINTNSLITNGDRLILRAGGSMTTATYGQNRRIRVLLGSYVIFDATIINGSTNPPTSLSQWDLSIEITRFGGVTCWATGCLNTNLYNASEFSFGQASVASAIFASAAWSSDQTLAVYGTALVGGSISQNTMSINYFPAPA